MKIDSLVWNSESGKYKCQFNSSEGVVAVTLGITISPLSSEDMTEEWVEKLTHLDLLDPNRDTHWVDKDEYIVPIPKHIGEPLPEDKEFTMGILSYYITRHRVEDYIFGVKIVESDGEINAQDLQYALYNYLNW